MQPTAAGDCERADFKIVVRGPGRCQPATGRHRHLAHQGHQPRSSDLPLALELELIEVGADCFPEGGWVGASRKAAFGPGRTRTHKVKVTCADQEETAYSRIRATVDPDARDPRLGNNKASRRTDWD